jgi:hypothetical protein
LQSISQAQDKTGVANVTSHTAIKVAAIDLMRFSPENLKHDASKP